MRLARLLLLDLIPALTPKWFRPDHLAPIAQLLERADRGEEVRACVSVPPQHGKTELVIAGVDWLLARHPEWRIGYASYNSTQARNKSRRARDLARELGLDVRRDADSTECWELVEGGAFLARGIGEGLTGQGLNGLIVDDPHKDRSEAESPAARRAVMDWFRSVGLTRVHPGGFILVVHTRWQNEDLIGELSRVPASEGGWEIVNLPAIRDDGKALCERLRPLAYLEQLRSGPKGVGDYEWASLYMGQPRPRGSMVFRDVYYYDELPKDGYSAAIGVDLAYSAKTSSDFSVRVDLLKKGDDYFVAGVHRAQVEARVFQSVLSEGRLLYPGAPMRWYSAGAEKGVADLLNTLDGTLGLAAIPATKDKLVRAQPVSAAWNSGHVLVPRHAPWLDQFLRVVLGFTGQGDAHDDDVDALAAAFDAVKGGEMTGALWA